MKEKYVYIILTIALIITAYGVITGRYFFLFLMIPLGFRWFKKGGEKD
ncbi:hypothetical protein N1F78_08190 [Seonamhaeicola sp. MEBiC1930]